MTTVRLPAARHGWVQETADAAANVIERHLQSDLDAIIAEHLPKSATDRAAFLRSELADIAESIRIQDGRRRPGHDPENPTTFQLCIMDWRRNGRGAILSGELDDDGRPAIAELRVLDVSQPADMRPDGWTTVLVSHDPKSPLMLFASLFDYRD